MSDFVKITAWNADDKSDATVKIVENNMKAINAVVDSFASADVEPTTKREIMEHAYTAA